jgi:hypothetical protein
VNTAAAAAQVANYEALYRRVIRTAPAAALMSVATFAFTYLPASSPEDPGNAAAAVQLPYSFYSSGKAAAEGCMSLQMQAAVQQCYSVM